MELGGLEPQTYARRTRLHLPRGWPWRHELVTAWQRQGALPVM
jgi:hypothetical protein